MSSDNHTAKMSVAPFTVRASPPVLVPAVMIVFAERDTKIKPMNSPLAQLLITLRDWVGAFHDGFIEDGKSCQREDIHQSKADKVVDRIVTAPAVEGQREPDRQASAEH